MVTTSDCTPLQASLNNITVEHEDQRPLLASNESHGSYGIGSPVSGKGEESDGEKSTHFNPSTRSGRYTPVGKNFSEVVELPRKPVWQVFSKDYDVSN